MDSMRSPARHVPGSRSGLIAWIVVCQMLFSALGGYATFQAGVYDRIITGGLKQTREHQEEGTWVGWTERDLRVRFGEPTMEYPYPHGPARTGPFPPARSFINVGAAVCMFG